MVLRYDNSFNYLPRRPALQITVFATALLFAYSSNKIIRYFGLKGVFENKMPSEDTWKWYRRHSVRPGENVFMEMTDYAPNLHHMMAKFDYRDGDSPFPTKK
ncbi:hypothetical protein ABK040_012088 [Willaertia magna]